MQSTQPFIALLGDIGAGELAVILLAALILFGGKGLPAMARKLGAITQKLQKASHEFKRQIMTGDIPPQTTPPPEPPPDHHADTP